MSFTYYNAESVRYKGTIIIMTPLWVTLVQGLFFFSSLLAGAEGM